MDIRKFNKEIQSLKNLPQGEGLHPLKKQQIKQQILQAIGSQKQPSRAKYFRLEMRSSFMRYVAVSAFGLCIILGGTAFASSSSKPGDVLFPVKKAKEQIQLKLTVSEQSRAQLQARFAGERLKEVKELDTDSDSKPPASINATSSIATSSEASGNKKDNDLQAKAKQDAKTEVDNALQVLKKVHTKLKVKGDTQAANAIQDNIVKLQTQARLQHINSVEIDDDSKGEEEKDDDQLRQSTATNPSQLQINVRQEGEVKGERKNGRNGGLDNLELGREIEDR